MEENGTAKDMMNMMGSIWMHFREAAARKSIAVGKERWFATLARAKATPGRSAHRNPGARGYADIALAQDTQTQPAQHSSALSLSTHQQDMEIRRPGVDSQDLAAMETKGVSSRRVVDAETTAESMR